MTYFIYLLVSTAHSLPAWQRCLLVTSKSLHILNAYLWYFLSQKMFRLLLHISINVHTFKLWLIAKLYFSIYLCRSWVLTTWNIASNENNRFSWRYNITKCLKCKFSLTEIIFSVGQTWSRSIGVFWFGKKNSSRH